MNKKLWKYIYSHNLLEGDTVHCDSLLREVRPLFLRIVQISSQETIPKKSVYSLIKNNSSETDIAGPTSSRELCL